MHVKSVKLLAAVCFAILLLPASLRPQSLGASISGEVTDPSGLTVPNAQLTLRAVDTGATERFTTTADGVYRFALLQSGAYELRVSAQGFRDFVRRGIKVNINETVRVDVELQLGRAVETVEVTANVSPINFDNAEVKSVIRPDIIDQLPLLVGGAMRSAAAFVTLMPGVSTRNENFYHSTVNGLARSSDDALVDGISIVDGANGQAGLNMMTGSGHVLSPHAIGEISLLASNYQSYRGGGSGWLLAGATRGGKAQFHGEFFEYFRNTALNSRQYGVNKRPVDIENQFGGNIGGPLNFIPGLRKLTWTGRKKTFFFVNYEGFRQIGAMVTPVLTIPTMKQRQGDFSDWKTTSGALVPIYDPATTVENPNYDPSQDTSPTNLPFLRDQFMGCDGMTPNVICASDPRLVNSVANKWFKFLPEPTFPDRTQRNYVVPKPEIPGALGQGTLINVRIDHNVGESDRFFATVQYHGMWQNKQSNLPVQISNRQPYAVNYAFLDRFNWDHIFNPRVLNHFGFGYNDVLSEIDSMDKGYADELYKIPGVQSYEFPPVIYMGDYETYGNARHRTKRRPAYIALDQLTWIRGKHTFTFGGEYRALHINGVERINQSGSLYFGRAQTGLIGISDSGNSVASFILEQMAMGTANFQTVDSVYPRQSYYSVNGGDTWKATPKLSVDYGLRWDVSVPGKEKFDRMTFFDPNGPNLGAGGLPGRVAYAGTKWGDASYGKHYPEHISYRGFAPRLGIAYSITPKFAVRAGYGLFFQPIQYPGWAGGIPATTGLTGFNFQAMKQATGYLLGMNSAFDLREGFPQDFPHPPFIDSTMANGTDAINFRSAGGIQPYGQQWNLTLERQFTENLTVTAAYVGTKGTRLYSEMSPINVIDPKYLDTMGWSLWDEFQPGQTSLNGVPAPYADWASQYNACGHSVAQAMVPYPQYCTGMIAMNENAGNSNYHALQLKVEKRYSHGLWLLGSYTASKALGSTDDFQVSNMGGSSGAIISPFQWNRNKALSMSDVPQSLAVSLIYELPVGVGKRYLRKGGILDKFLGGWLLSSIYRIQSPLPEWFRVWNGCAIPSQLGAQCLPAINEGANPFAQDMKHFDPSKPLFDRDAFESADNFILGLGHGPRVSNVRAFRFHNHDLSISKRFRITEKMSFDIRGQFFNAWNWHTFNCSGVLCYYSTRAFEYDVANPRFGMWNGSISAPRNIQLVANLKW